MGTVVLLDDGVVSLHLLQPGAPLIAVGGDPLKSLHVHRVHDGVLCIYFLKLLLYIENIVKG
jgi:hypothetical protein